MPTTPTTFATTVATLIDAAKARAADGLTISDFAQITLDVCRATIAAADGLAIPGRDKKAWVLEATAVLFDAIADRMVPTLAWPVWLLLRPAARALVLAVASGAIETILPLVRLAP